MENKKVYAWCLYDWGSSAHATIIATFIFSVYFTQSVYGDATDGASFWAYLTGISAFLTALTAPFLGAKADNMLTHKSWLLGLTLFCAITTACLWFSKPDPSSILLTSVFVVLSLASFELAVSFNNAILPKLVKHSDINKYSNIGWGLGYFGGLTALLLCLILFIGLDDFLSPVFNLDREQFHHIRITPVVTALWFLVFSLPLLILYKDQRTKKKISVSTVLEVWSNVKQLILLKEKRILLFLIASAIYRDGLITLFAVGGIYASDLYNMPLQEILLFAIALNICAGLGGFLFAFLNQILGSYRSIVFSLSAMIALSSIIIFVNDKIIFLILACFFGLFLGPCQAASRSFMVEISPFEKIAQYMGFYAMTGKSIAMTGPLLYGLFVVIFDTQKAGMAVIVFLLAIGLLILSKVKK